MAKLAWRGLCDRFVGLASQVAVNTLDAANALNAPTVALLYQGGSIIAYWRQEPERDIIWT